MPMLDCHAPQTVDELLLAIDRDEDPIACDAALLVEYARVNGETLRAVAVKLRDALVTYASCTPHRMVSNEYAESTRQLLAETASFVDHPHCEQVNCHEPASSRMYWPGRPSALVCVSHGERAHQVAEAMGFTLVLQPVTGKP